MNDDKELANDVSLNEDNMGVDGPSAADYDPTMDMQEDKARDDQRHLAENSSLEEHGEKEQQHSKTIIADTADGSSKVTKDVSGDFDMFAEDDEVEDIFAQSPKIRDRKAAKANSTQQAKRLDESLLDDWDDPDGYYRIILGEMLDRRYHVQENLGRGMFSGVVRALDTTKKGLVAIKIIRNNDTM